MPGSEIHTVFTDRGENDPNSRSTQPSTARLTDKYANCLPRWTIAPLRVLIFIDGQ